MSAPAHSVLWERIWRVVLRVFVGLVLFYLIFPILVIIPLSFNQLPYFVFTEEMLSFDPAGYSLQWYEDFSQRPQLANRRAQQRDYQH